WAKAHLAPALTALVDRHKSYAASYAAGQEREWNKEVSRDGAATMGAQAVIAAQNGSMDEVRDSLNASDGALREGLRVQYPATGNAEADKQIDDVIAQRLRENRGRNLKAAVEGLSATGDPRSAPTLYNDHKTATHPRHRRPP